MKKRGQTSVEAIILLSAILIVISFILAFRENVMDSITNSHYGAKAKIMSEKVADTGAMLYQQGVGARTVIYLEVPDKINSIILTGNVIETSYNLSGKINTQFVETDFILNGSMPQRGGSYCILLESKTGYVKVSNYNSSC